MIICESDSKIDAWGRFGYRFNPILLLVAVPPVNAQIVPVRQWIRHAHFAQLLHIILKPLTFSPGSNALACFPMARFIEGPWYNRPIAKWAQVLFVLPLFLLLFFLGVLPCQLRVFSRFMLHASDFLY